PSEEAVTIALRTQEIIAEESSVTNTVDPLGGSYFLEALTNKTEAAVYEYFSRIEQLGGVLPAIQAGFFQQEIANASYQHKLEMDRDERVIVGVNKYASEESMRIPILAMDPEGYNRQIDRLNTLRRERDHEPVERSLNAVRHACV